MGSCEQRLRGEARKQEWRYKIMENTNTETTVVDTEVKDGASAADETTREDVDTKNAETVTISKTDYDKAIQSAEDKIRGHYSKEINDLKDKIKELTPVEKSQAEIDLENRIAALEESERIVAAQKKRLEFQENLTNKGLDKSLVDFLKEDTDVDALVSVVDGIVKSRMKSTGYVPTSHDSDDLVSQEEFNKMSYDKRVELYKKNPTLYERLTKRRK
jgi:hypothetical protein|nr:MAG TPA: protein of unknown function (DUF4355) [Caudoviricetes sp.]